MRLTVFIVLALLVMPLFTNAQGVFESAGSGIWQDKNTWTLISGSDANGRPDADDQVTILSGHTISIQNDQSCDVLTFSGGALSYNQNRTVTVITSVSVTANSNINGYSNDHIFDNLGTLTVNSSVTFSVGAVRFNTGGAMTLNGALNISGYGQTRNFDDVSVSGTGTLSLSGGDTYNFNGDLENNGTFTATSYGQTFNFLGSSNSFSGTGQISLFSATFNSPANYTNNGVLQIRSSISGTGSFTNGNGGQLELQNGGPFTVGTFDASATGNTITYTGYGSPTAFSGDYYNLVLNKSSGALSFGSSLTVNNDLTIQSGILQVNAVTLNIGNDVNLEGGEFTPDNASAIVNIGGDLNVSAGEYDHNNGAVDVTGNIAITGGSFYLNGSGSTIDAGSVSLQGVALTLSEGTWTTTGDFDLETGSNLTGNGANIAIGGAFNFNAGAANFTGGSLTANQIYSGSGTELFINAINLNVSGQVELDGTITFNNGTGTKAVGSILVNGTGNWNVTQPLNITVSGDITNNGTFTGDPGYGTSVYTLTSTSGTISGASTLSIRDIDINSPASYTNEGNLYVGGSLDGTGTFINGTDATFTFAGNNSGGSNFTLTNFTASATGNTVVWAGTTHNQRWRTTTSANNDYYNVTVNMGTGDYQRLNLIADVRVNGTLTITEGDPVLGAFDLELMEDATISGGDTNDWIRINSSGVVRKYYDSFGADLSLPIGDSDDYSPITSFVVNSATLGATPYVEFSITDANHPNRNTNNLGVGGNDDGTAATAYISRYWTLNGNDMSVPDYSLSYIYTDGDITGTESDMIAALYRTPIGESFLDWDVAGVVNPSTNTATISNADNWGAVYAMDDNGGRLPIELISFDARTSGADVVLTWETATEENNDYFTLERSYNGVNFQTLSTIAGAGNSNKVLSYRCEDKYPLQGRSYYRLKQTDFNGQFSYSEVVSVLVENHTALQIKVYPNPLTSSEPLFVSGMESLSPNSEAVFYKLSGKEVMRAEVQNGRSIDINSLKPGIYILRVVDNGQFIASKKVVVNSAP